MKYYVYVFGKGKELNYADIETGKAFAPNADGTFSYECTDLPETEDNEYQVVIGFTYADKTYYGEVKTFKVDKHPFCPDSNHPHIIDLGLPSGTKWACCNVGASFPDDYSSFFAWGETSTKGEYTPENYKYGWQTEDDKGTTAFGVTKYCYTDGLTELLPEDDVATVKWGSDWRMPTIEQLQELINDEYTTMEKITMNGRNGWKATSKSNGNCLFLPAHGYFYRSLIFCIGLEEGFFWSRSVDRTSCWNGYEGNYACAHSLMFNSVYIRTTDSTWRDWGMSVRPVHVQN